MKKWLGLFLFPLVLAGSLAPAKFQPERAFSPSAGYSSDAFVFDHQPIAPDQNESSTVDFTRPLGPVLLTPNHRIANDFNLSLITPVSSPIAPVLAYNGATPNLDGVLVSFYTQKSPAQDDVFVSNYCSTNVNCMTSFNPQLAFGGGGGGGQKSPGSQNNDANNPPIITAGNLPPVVPSFGTGSGSGSGSGNGNDTNPIPGTSLNGPDRDHKKPMATPEPSSFTLLLAGLVGLALLLKLRG
jgi:hypothetical protein